MVNIGQEGQLVPAMVDKEYKLIAGNTRYQALCLAAGIRRVGPDKLREIVKQHSGASADAGAVEAKTTLMWAAAGACEQKLNVIVVDTEASNPNRVSVEENLNHEPISPVDLGYYFKSLVDEGQTIAQIAITFYPGRTLVNALQCVEECIKLTNCAPKVQNELREKKISLRQALNTLKSGAGAAGPGTAEDKAAIEAAAEPVYRFSPKQLRLAISTYDKVETGDRLAGFQNLFDTGKLAGREICTKYGVALYDICKLLLTTKAEKPKRTKATKTKKAKKNPTTPAPANVAAAVPAITQTDIEAAPVVSPDKLSEFLATLNK
jgi:hypothetical protein